VFLLHFVPLLPLRQAIAERAAFVAALLEEVVLAVRAALVAVRAALVVQLRPQAGVSGASSLAGVIPIMTASSMAPSYALCATYSN